MVLRHHKCCRNLEGFMGQEGCFLGSSVLAKVRRPCFRPRALGTGAPSPRAIKLPPKALQILQDLGGSSCARWLRLAESFMLKEG